MLKYIVISFLFISKASADELAIQQRALYDQIQSSILSDAPLPSLDAFPFCYDKKISCQTGRELFVQALDELLLESRVSQIRANQLIEVELNKDIPVFDQIHIAKTFNRRIYTPIGLDPRSRNYLKPQTQLPIQSWVNRYDIAKALLNDKRHSNAPKLFMFCRDNREHKCLLLMKDHDGKLMDWAQSALGFSKHGKDFFETNGNTPSGVWRLESVMPYADQNELFGKYRRIIVNFVAQSPGEQETKKLLPEMTHNDLWWTEAVIARNNGRGLFRIHGTGLESTEAAPFFPLVPTSGCVAQSENTYKNIEYHDQRHLLDKLMVASGLDPIYENEKEISGLLFVIDIDKKEEPVTIKSLEEVGILASQHRQ